MKRMMLFAVALVAFGATAAAAQVGNRTVTVGLSATVPEILSISSNGQDFVFGTLTEAQFNANLATATAGPTLTTGGNVAYKVTAQAAAANLSGGSGSKPTSAVTITGGSASVALNGTTAVPVFTGAAGGPTATPLGATMALDYASDTPGTYTTTITFTIAHS